MLRIDERLLGNWARVALNLLTLSVVAYFLASAAALLFVPRNLPTLGTNGLESNSKDVKVPIKAYKEFSPIWARNVFKAAMPKPPPPPKPVPLDKLPVAKLQASLLGTMFSEVKELSRAVILEGNNQRLVKVGDKLSGFSIAEIQRRAIVLQNGNQRQLLLIDATDKEVVGKDNEQRKMISRSEIKSKLTDLDALANDIQFAMATRGNDQGLWVRQLRAGSVFSKAGLQKDDVVLSVGGQSVASGANPVALFKLIEQPQVVVDILRNGKKMKLLLVITGD